MSEIAVTVAMPRCMTCGTRMRPVESPGPISKERPMLPVYCPSYGCNTTGAVPLRPVEAPLTPRRT